jgi:two-component system, chemotaxis family, protein-glutamate methylesterase/glutaminase
MREVEVDHIVPISEMAELLIRLSRETVPASADTIMEDDKQTAFEIRTAAEDKATMDIMKFGDLTPYTCPECHGVLFRLTDGHRPRFRCHTGHAFSSDSLLATVTESIEENLWSAIRCIEESVMLLNHLGDHFSQNNQPGLAAVYYKKAFEAQERGSLVRQTVMNHERLSADRVREQAGDERGGEKSAKGER